MSRILPGSYSIKSLQIISEDTSKSIDIANVFTQIDIFESIFFPVITGFITVTDANNLISGQNSLPIMGNELVYLELILPSFQRQFEDGRWGSVEDNEIVFVGRVTDIKNKVLVTGRSQNYEIHFVAQEGILDRNIHINQSYKDKTYLDIITNIFNQFGAIDSYEFEETIGTHQIIIPGWNPLKSINWLASRSVSAKYNTSTFFFFQTLYNDGATPSDRTSYTKSSFRNNVTSKYWFLSLDDMLAYPEKKKIFFRPANLNLTAENFSEDGPYYMVFSNAMNYEVINSFDTLINNENGLYNSQMITHDITKKEWKILNYNYIEEFPKYQHLENNLLYTGNPDRFGKKFTDYESARGVMTSTGRIESPNRLDKVSLSRLNRIQSLNNYKIRIVLPGDGLLESGDIIDFDLPSPEPDGERKFDRYYAGKYLITSIRHSFSKIDYKITLECAKDSLKQDVR
jgi:hypothetical protein